MNKRCTICDPDCPECQANPNYICPNPSQVAFCNKEASMPVMIALAAGNSSVNDTNGTSNYVQCLDSCPLGYY